MDILILLILVLVAILKTESESCKHTIKPYHLVLSPLNHFIKKGALDGPGPFLDISKYPEVTKLADEWQTIWGEFEESKNRLRPIKGERFFRNNIIEDDKWKRIKFKFYGPWQHQEEFPKTVELLKKIPGLKAAMISVLEPGAKIKPHVGLSSACARVHIGLSCPLNTKMRILDSIYEWRVGEVKMFDDTFLHAVTHEGDFDRVILFLDVERKTRNTFASKASLVLANLANLRIND